MSIVKKHLLILGFVVASLSAFGQASRSPYSTFGIGETFGSALAHNQGMAGVGVSNPQYWNINNQNPALLVYNTFTMFGAGILVDRRTISAGDVSEKSTNGNMNYLVTAFPIKPGKWTTSAGLMPFSRVNYQLQYTDLIENSTDVINVTEEGSGGITQLYWSNGVRVAENLNVGLKASYLFSSLITTYRNQLNNNTPPAAYLAAIEEKSYVKDFAFSAGVSYILDSLFTRSMYRLNFGAVYNFAADLNTNRTDKLYRTVATGDTIESTIINQRKGQIYVPSSFTLGVSLSRGIRWTVGTEFTFQDWSSFKSMNADEEGLKKSWRLALGGELTPDPYAVENYLKRITYRIGVSTEEYPYLANGNKVTDLGINFGMSLPSGRSSLDLGFKLGKRGNKTDNIIAEDYFKIYFGITFNDQWFIKRRFD